MVPLAEQNFKINKISDQKVVLEKPKYWEFSAQKFQFSNFIRLGRFLAIIILPKYSGFKGSPGVLIGALNLKGHLYYKSKTMTT